MQGRLYDARIGRFMQADPPFLESPGWSQGLNRYSYVFNNPLNLIDPSGFMEEHDHPDDEDVSVSESTDPETGMPVFEQSPITEEGGESFGVDEGSLNDNADEEAETSPGQGDPADESGVGGKGERLSDEWRGDGGGCDQECRNAPNGAQAPPVNHELLNDAVPQVRDTHEAYDTAGGVLFHIATLPIGAIGNGIKWGLGILRGGRAATVAVRGLANARRLWLACALWDP